MGKAKKNYESERAESNKGSNSDDKGIIESTTDYVKDTVSSVTGFFGAKTEEAKHKANEERHSAQRKAKKEQVKNDDADISDRVSAAGDYVTEGAKELKEKSKKNYESERAESQ